MCGAWKVRADAAMWREWGLNSPSISMPLCLSLLTVMPPVAFIATEKKRIHVQKGSFTFILSLHLVNIKNNKKLCAHWCWRERNVLALYKLVFLGGYSRSRNHVFSLALLFFAVYLGASTLLLLLCSIVKNIASFSHRNALSFLLAYGLCA